MAASNFLTVLNTVKIGADIFHNSINSVELYGFDVKAAQRTYLTDDIHDAGKGVNIHNVNAQCVNHVCVDGGMIPYRFPDYIGDGKPHGRFDSLVFSDNTLLLVEYKMDSTSEKDKTKWANFSHGMKQIKEYFLHLKLKFQLNGDDIHNHYSVEKTIPFICMSNVPGLNPRVNAQRLTEMERFRVETGGLKIKYGTAFTLE